MYLQTPLTPQYMYLQTPLTPQYMKVTTVPDLNAREGVIVDVVLLQNSASIVVEIDANLARWEGTVNT